jgi:hypothetical protein
VQAFSQSVQLPGGTTRKRNRLPSKEAAPQWPL